MLRICDEAIREGKAKRCLAEAKSRREGRGIVELRHGDEWFSDGKDTKSPEMRRQGGTWHCEGMEQRRRGIAKLGIEMRRQSNDEHISAREWLRDETKCSGNVQNSCAVAEPSCEMRGECKVVYGEAEAELGNDVS